MPQADERGEIRRAATVNRRRFLTVSGAAAAFGTNLASRHTSGAAPGALHSYPFTLGIASGDPQPDAVVLWTRIAPEVFDPMGGMPYQNYPVDWQVATDERFRHVVRAGTAAGVPACGAGRRWKIVASVRGNAVGMVSSTFTPVQTTGLRITTLAGNGANDYSRIVELAASGS